MVPLKRFDLAKSRLRTTRELDVTALVGRLARAVIENCGPRPVIVVTEDDEIAAFASAHGAETLLTDSSGLNDALQRAYATLGPRFAQLIIAHGDLRQPEGLGAFVPEPGISLFGDHRGEGTNVMAIPTGLDFHFAYGSHSLRRHAEEAERIGVPYRIDLTSPWRFDVDEPDDVVDFEQHRR